MDKDRGEVPPAVPAPGGPGNGGGAPPPSTPPSAPPRDLARRLPRIAASAVPAILALLAEAGWIAAVYALVQTAAGEPVLLGPVAFAAAAAAAALVAPRGPRSFGDRWPVVAVAFVAAAGVVGWLASAAALGALSRVDAAAALGEHSGGWLLGLAAFRGIAQARVRDDDSPAGSLLTVGVPALVLAFLLGGALAEPERSLFRAAAYPDALLFVGAGLVGLTLARVQSLGSMFGLDWYRNPVWVAMLLALVAAILLVAVPASFSVGAVVVLLVAALPVPLFVAGLFMGVDRRTVAILVATIGLASVAILLLRIFFPDRAIPTQPAGGGGVPLPRNGDEPWLTVASAILAVVGLAAAIGVVVALWMRRALQVPDGDVGEERVIDRGTGGGRWTWRALRRGRHGPGDPRDAAEAYLASIAALETYDDLRRATGETPAEHAGRLRLAARQRRLDAGAEAGTDAGAGGRSLPSSGPISGPISLLAADYELARFGGRELTPREHRRALARWESIRRTVGGRRPGR